MNYLTILFAVLLLASPAFGQSAQWPAGKVIYSNGDNVEDERDIMRTYAHGSLPTCDSDAAGQTVYINDGSAAGVCSPGGTAWVLCGCVDTGGAVYDWTAVGGGGGGGAPTTADYLTGTAQAGLSNEIVVGATPGGELGGTWASPTIDATHAGSAHPPTDADYLVETAQAGLSNETVVGTSPGGELGGTWASPTVDATHSGSAHPTVNGSTVPAIDLQDSLVATFIECTGAGTPALQCPSDDAILLSIPNQDSHRHRFDDLITRGWECTDLYDTGGPPQTSGSPDGKCDRDGTTLTSAIGCADIYDSPVAPWFSGPGGTQNACVDGGSNICGDGFCDVLSIYPDSTREYVWTDQSTPSFNVHKTSGASLPWWFKLFAEDGTSGTYEGMRVELDVEDLDVKNDNRDDANAASAVLKLSATPSDVDFSYPNIVFTRNEEDVGHLKVAYNHAVTKKTGVTDVAFDGSHGGIDVALAMGDNNITTSCTDRFNAAQTSGSPDGVADRDGLTSLCTDLYDTGSPTQTSGSPDGLCDSDGSTAVETDNYDTGTLPQSGCSGASYGDIAGCLDDFCDLDGATAWPDTETFSDTDFEAVLNGGSVDNADAEHTHTIPPVCTYIEDPVSSESFESVWRAPTAVTITEIWCEVDAGSVAFDLSIDDGTPQDLNTSDPSCTTSTGTTDSTFDNSADMAANDRLDFVLGTVTTAVRLSVCFRYVLQ